MAEPKIEKNFQSLLGFIINAYRMFPVAEPVFQSLLGFIQFIEQGDIGGLFITFNPFWDLSLWQGRMLTF